MKQQLKSLLIPALLFFVGCSQVEIVPPNDPAPIKEAVATVLEAMDADGKEWSVGDEIAVFSSADVDSTCKFTCTAKNGDVAVFEGTCIPGSKICALYPYSENSSLYIDGNQYVLNADMPGSQEVGKPALVLAALAEEGKLVFKPAYATIRLSLASEAGDEPITAISVVGNNGEDLSGAVKIVFGDGLTPTLLQPKSKNSNAAEIVGDWTLGTKPIYVDMNLAAQTLENGVTVSVTKADGIVSQKSFDQNMIFKSNDIAELPEFVLEGPKYYILFTSDSPLNLPGYKVVWDEATKEGKIFLMEPVIVESFLMDNTNITSLYIPNFITSIEKWGFRKMTALKEVTFEAGSQCTLLGEQAFQNSPLLGGIFTVPASVKQIGKGCFVGNVFTEIKFEEGSVLTTINDNAFNVTTLNKPVILPPSVTTMGNVFNNQKFANKLVVHCLAKVPPTIGASLFHSKFKNYEIYVPAASLDAYKAAWATYAGKIKALP